MSYDHEKIYIDGAWVPSQGSDTIDVFDSSNGEVIGHIPNGNAADVDAAVKAAAAAFPAWAATSAEERAKYCTRIAEGLGARMDEIATVVTREAGMPKWLSLMIQAGLPINSFNTAAQIAESYEYESTNGNSLIVREPIGVVGCITPWNYPLHQIAAKVAYAMAAGCTVVLKPSEIAPLDAFILAEVIDEVGLPAGVFNLVSGTGPEVGEAISAHPKVDMVSFTGSTRAGKAVSKAAADSIIVTPPWNFPVAIPAGSTLAALASGSAVVIKPARQARRCGAVMVEALWEAGVPRDVLQLVQLSDSALGERLVASPAVDQVILTGGYETAELFRGFRQDLRLLGETSGKNAIIVTPSADLDLAVKDVVHSAFGHAGQKCSAASLVILVGSVATSRRFRTQLVDAVRSLHVALPTDPTAQVGPVIAPPSGKLLEGLTTIGEGESWLIEPRALSSGAEPVEASKLWTPGVRDGVRRGSEYHLTEYFGPILGIMTAETLDEAIAIQNEVDYGLTAGLHSLDVDEVRRWLASVQAGNLYVNRGITGAIVQRQPFGGWKKSVVGAGFKAGGPNYLAGLGRWTDAEPVRDAVTPRPSRVDALVTAAAPSLDEASQAWLAQAVASDAAAWSEEFGALRDRSGLAAERNVFRYLPAETEIRAEAGTPLVEIVRVAAAAIRTGASVKVSVAEALPPVITTTLRGRGFDVVREDASEAHARLAGLKRPRVRLLGAPASVLDRAAAGRPDIAVFDSPVTRAGRVELLPFVHEQAVSITAHRFGNPDALAAEVL